MIRTLFRTLLWLFMGVLAGQAPVGGTTLGNITLRHSQSALAWTTQNVQSLVSHAGVGTIDIPAWVEHFRTPAASKRPTPAPRTEPDSEGLTAEDKEALRRLLE